MPIEKLADQYKKSLSDDDRDRIRNKQDQLLTLIGDSSDDLQLSAEYPGSPTVGELRSYLYPEWESLIDRLIEEYS